MPAVLDLFCGAGGLSLGLKAAGFVVAAGVDSDRDSCLTYEHFHGGSSQVHNGLVGDVDLSHYRGIDVVAGGPPCQPFSTGGKGRGLDDPRDAVPAYIEAVRKLRPKAFLLENVKGLVSPRHREYFQDVLRSLQGLGYRLTWGVLNSADYGVPQRRERLFLVGVGDSGGPYNFPAPMYGPGREYPHIGVGRVVCAECPLGDANPDKVVYASTPRWGRTMYVQHLVNGPGRPLDLAKPSNTVVSQTRSHILDVDGTLEAYHRHLVGGGSPRSGVVDGVRRLTLDECAKIQTFPVSAKFMGTTRSQFRQVGNAVPPLLGEALGRSIIDQIFRAKS